MSTQGISSFNPIRSTSFLDQAAQRSERSAALSGEEQNMIQQKFSRKSVALEFYEGSGSVRRERPTGRGGNIDITV